MSDAGAMASGHDHHHDPDEGGHEFPGDVVPIGGIGAEGGAEAQQRPDQEAPAPARGLGWLIVHGGGDCYGAPHCYGH